MISGIYGMNLVIEMLGEPIQLSDIVKFTLFEWIALMLAILGLLTMTLLIINQVYNFTISFYGKIRRKRQR